MTINPTPTVIWQIPAKRRTRVIPPLGIVEDEFASYTVTAVITAPASGIAQDTNVVGWAYGETGLGYYPNPANNNQFMPVHLPTGIALSDTFLTLTGCQSYLREIATKLDWHGVGEKGPPDMVIPDLVAIKKKYI
jgi:hypothetical protein